MKNTLVLLILIISLVFHLSSCSGMPYDIQYSYSDFADDLVSAELISGHLSKEERSNVISTLALDDVKEDLISKIVDKPLHCKDGPGISECSVTVKLTYSDGSYCLICQYHIHFYDSNGTYSPLTEKSHNVRDYEYSEIVEAYFNELLNDLDAN